MHFENNVDLQSITQKVYEVLQWEYTFHFAGKPFTLTLWDVMIFSVVCHMFWYIFNRMYEE